jgi:hypothetical protein
LVVNDYAIKNGQEVALLTIFIAKNGDQASMFVQVFIVENVIVVRKHNYFACKIRREYDG